MEREETLERLVALHAERVAEEQAGRVRWLRPEYQVPRYAPAAPAAGLGIPDQEADDGPGEPAAHPPIRRSVWPSSAVEQLGAVKAAAERVGADAKAVLAAFDDADAGLVARHLETLVVMGEV
jgi:hypothetical protein